VEVFLRLVGESKEALKISQIHQSTQKDKENHSSVLAFISLLSHQTLLADS